MLIPYIVAVSAALGIHVSVTDTLRPEGYPDAQSCLTRVAEIVAGAKRADPGIKIITAVCRKK